MTPPRPGGPHPESGRAGRLRLRHRLEAALRGAGLLDRKVAVLRERHRLLAAEEEAALQAWHTAVEEAETWLLRGLLLSGERALAVVVTNRADVVVEWTVSMGVRHPSRAVCTDAVRAPTEPLPANTALAHAETAYRTVVRTAAGYAAARTAAGLVQAEIDRTGRRVRALRRHWIPRLAEALAHLDQGLEQAEHEDAVRRRWAAGTPARPSAAGAGSGDRADTTR